MYSRGGQRAQDAQGLPRRGRRAGHPARRLDVHRNDGTLMSTLAGEFWVCGQCRSINNAGAKQCYNCRTPKRSGGRGSRRDRPDHQGPGPRRIGLPEFRSSRWAALLASILILVVAVMQIVQWNLVATLGDQMLGGIDPTEDQLAYIEQGRDPRLRDRPPGADRVVALAESDCDVDAGARPGLSSGEWPDGVRRELHPDLQPLPRASDRARRRPSPRARRSSRGEALIFAAWIGLVGGFIVPARPGILRRRYPDGRRRSAGSATGLVLVGAIFLVVLIWWIEGRIATAGARSSSPEEEPGRPRHSTASCRQQPGWRHRSSPTSYPRGRRSRPPGLGRDGWPPSRNRHRRPASRPAAAFSLPPRRRRAGGRPDRSNPTDRRRACRRNRDHRPNPSP